MTSLLSDPNVRSARRDAIAQLLIAYPNIDDSECENIVDFITRDASALDMALLASDDGTREPLAKFRSDFGARMKSSISPWLVVAAIVAVVSLLCTFAWDLAK